MDEHSLGPVAYDSADNLLRRTRWFLLISITIIVSGIASVALIPVNGDVAWLLYVAERVLVGERLYVDLVEINPPLIVYLSLPAVLLAKALGVTSTAVFSGFTLSLGILSVLLSARILHAAAPFRWIFGSFSVLLVFAAFSPLLWAGSFGEREHLAVVLVLPYLILSAARANSIGLPRPWAMGIGLLGGIGLALKPFFLPLWIAIEAYLWCRNRAFLLWARPENLTIVGVLCTYLLVIILFAHEYFAVAQLAMHSYGGYNRPILELILHPKTLASLLGVSLYLALRPSSQIRALGDVLLLATISFLGALLIQQKGFGYHFLPMQAFSFLSVGVVVLDRIGHASREPSDHRRRALMRVAYGVLLVTGSAIAAVHVITFYESSGIRGTFDRMRALVHQHARGQSILTLSSEMYLSFPLVNNSGVGWSSRFPSLALVPGFYDRSVLRGQAAFAYRSPEQMQEAERFIVDAVISDMQARMPAMLMVDAAPAKPEFGGVDFDWVKYLSMDSRFAVLFSEYTYLTDVGPLRVYKRDFTRTP